MCVYSTQLPWGSNETKTASLPFLPVFPFANARVKVEQTIKQSLSFCVSGVVVRLTKIYRSLCMCMSGGGGKFRISRSCAN